MSGTPFAEVYRPDRQSPAQSTGSANPPEGQSGRGSSTPSDASRGSRRGNLPPPPATYTTHPYSDHQNPISGTSTNPRQHWHPQPPLSPWHGNLGVEQAHRFVALDPYAHRPVHRASASAATFDDIDVAPSHSVPQPGWPMDSAGHPFIPAPVYTPSYGQPFIPPLPSPTLEATPAIAIPTPASPRRPGLSPITELTELSPATVDQMFVPPASSSITLPVPVSQPWHPVVNYPAPETTVGAIVRYVTTELPKEMYSLALLRLPSLYFSRVARIFEEADLTLNEIKRMALESGTKPSHAGHYTFMTTNQVPMSPAYEGLKQTWETFIDSVMREWKTFNIISVLLLSAILTILQIEDAANDVLTRYTALGSLVAALISLLYGCVYIIRFGTMRTPKRAAEWALEAQKSKAAIFWNVWVMLAMPAVWLTWSLILYICCIMSFVWRTSTEGVDRRPLTPSGLLAVRTGVTTILALGSIYGVLIILTFRRYGEAMDKAWKRRVNQWLGAQNAHPHIRFQSAAQPFGGPISSNPAYNYLYPYRDPYIQGNAYGHPQPPRSSNASQTSRSASPPAPHQDVPLPLGGGSATQYAKRDSRDDRPPPLPSDELEQANDPRVQQRPDTPRPQNGNRNAGVAHHPSGSMQTPEIWPSTPTTLIPPPARPLFTFSNPSYPHIATGAGCQYFPVPSFVPLLQSRHSSAQNSTTDRSTESKRQGASGDDGDSLEGISIKNLPT